MRRTVLVAFYTACLFGCGTCGTCDQKQPGDDDAIAPTATGVKPTTKKDGGADEPAEASTTKSTDAMAMFDATPIVGMPILRLPTRPPIPPGPIQSCGVYDGPLCEKICEKGNCRQDCDGVECTLACPGGYCVQQCGAQAKCRMTCKGGGCMQVCSKQEGCVKECDGPNKCL